MSNPLADSGAVQIAPSRQIELMRLAPGDPVLLVREAENPQDSRAPAIKSEQKVTVGYLSRDHASWVASKIDRGYPIQAVVSRIRGGSPMVRSAW